MPYSRFQFAVARAQRLIALLAVGWAGPELGAVTYFGPVANWRVSDGVPSHKVVCALQTRDGYIWLGTWDGLARFDGASFTRFDVGRTPGLKESNVTALCEAPDGALWLGHSSGSVTRMRDGKLTYYPAPALRQRERIQNLTWDEAGDVWACNIAGHVFRVRDDYTLVPETGRSAGIFFMAGSPTGEIAVVSRGRLSILQRGQLHPVEVRPDMQSFIGGVCSSRDGGWWVVEQGRLWKWKAGEWTDLQRPVPSALTPVYTMAELRDGRLVGATYDAGAWVMNPTTPGDERRFTRATGFVSDWITSVFEDREGGLWLATGTAGLCRVADKRMTMLAPADDFDGRPTLSVTEGRDGTLWVGTEGAGVYRFREGAWDRFRTDIGLWNHFVWSIAESSDGTIWAGTWGNGVFRFDDGKFIPPDRRTGTYGARVAAMIPSVRGGLLVGGLEGIYHWNGSQPQWLEAGPARVATNVRALLEEDAGDTVWAGGWGCGLVQIGRAGIRQYTQNDGLASNDVNCLHRARSGALWIGTNGGGLSRLKDGRIGMVRAVNGLTDNTIGYIAEDAHGYFWLSSRAGLMRIAAAQLDACADGTLAQLEVEIFGYSDGLTTLNFNAAAQPAGCTLRDGRLAFATDRGVAVVDPERVPRNLVPPPVYIESVDIDGHRTVVGDARAVTVKVPAGFERLEIQYTALSFAGPEKVVFSRQLLPLERRATILRGERSVVYRYLRPGSYMFRLGAANNDGVWNPEMRTIAIVVLPFFWQTLWFRALVAVLLVGAGGAIAWYVSRRRLQRRVELLERERAVERERTRIARDMHDELGSQLTRISMLSESAQRQTANPARRDERLDQIYETAREVTKAMDEIVWTVNPTHDTLESLVIYLGRYAADFLGAAGVACRIDAPYETIAWSPDAEVRHNLFLCVKEALTNVVRHSGATIVVLIIRAGNGEFSVQIVDNGRGLPPVSSAGEHSRAGGGNGLANLRVRMGRLGGSCEIVSSPAAGCTVSLRVPMSDLPSRRVEADDER